LFLISNKDENETDRRLYIYLQHGREKILEATLDEKTFKNKINYSVKQLEESVVVTWKTLLSPPSFSLFKNVPSKIYYKL